jgi:hypothetical protein
MTNEELDRATADEAWRLWQIQGADHPQPATIAARLAREGWTPPEPVDPDLLALKGWLNGPFRVVPTLEAAYLAGARMAREQEQERAKGLVEYVSVRAHISTAADNALAAYKAGRAAR